MNYERLGKALAINRELLQVTFADCADVSFRDLSLGPNGPSALLIYIDGLVQADLLQEGALAPLLHELAQAPSISPDALRQGTITLPQVETATDFPAVTAALLDCRAAILIDGFATALLLDVAGGTRRGIEEPVTEASIRGPREGFNESLRTNTALLRFRLKSAKLKFVAYTFGRETQTKVELAYMEDLIDPAVLSEVRRRLESIEVDAILESGYIEELIEDDAFSPFPQLQNSERPDTVAANLLEGRFAIFVDCTPFVLVGPVTFWQMMQASEDYYERWGIATLIRTMRYIFLFLALFLPSLYVAVSTFHQDMLPTTLLLSIAAAREAIPFPALVEALGIEITFEALREASIRLPRTVGQAVSILGALVIGQSAVQAGIISAPMVIVVAITGIASFTIPKFNAAIAIRILRFPLMLLAGTFGLFGLIIGVYGIVLHLCGLRSFGVPYLSGYAPLKPNELKDLVLRAPWWFMKLRPNSYTHRNRQRMSRWQKPTPPR